jgi:3-phenylpropionate/cinnamic acid dioxygenase small subunit
MPSPETEITNLLYQYAECVDSGDFDGAASLFEHAQLRVGPDDGPNDIVNVDRILALWRRMIIVYPDGTPRTKHMVTNPIVEVDEGAGTATCRSYYTVLQRTDDFPLQVVVTGRYDDRFERVDGRWRFCYRDYTKIDQVGDISHHLSQRI